MKNDPRIKQVGEIETEFLFDIVVDLEPRQDFKLGPYGRRVLFLAAGGTFSGPRMKGEVLAGGGDWTVFRSDGAMVLDVRLTLQMDDGELVMMTYGGRWVTPASLRTQMSDTSSRHEIDPALYYFRTNPLFETGAEPYAWMNDIVCVGKGYLVPGGVAYKVFCMI